MTIIDDLPDYLVTEADRSKWVLLDDSNAVRFVRHSGADEATGLSWAHYKPNPGDRHAWCLGGIRWDTPGSWTLESREPLTVTPSLLCSCGAHGFIRDGGWVAV